jgi:hypothetical protein
VQSGTKLDWGRTKCSEERSWEGGGIKQTRQAREERWRDMRQDHPHTRAGIEARPCQQSIRGAGIEGWVGCSGQSAAAAAAAERVGGFSLDSGDGDYATVWTITV